ncbi:uncharacterized protein LOC143191058 isoform X3 [Rhynchophorus ferrugineus]|uniref:uncharacterized protein LOC143191058 isoform X3 n=1 Tax=Rhynchophorus ferrugineus TaxID=354439 RepID=UPI003FCC4AE1
MIIGYVFLLCLFNNLKSIRAGYEYDECPSEINPKIMLLNTVTDFKSKPLHYKLNRRNYQGLTIYFKQQYISNISTEAFVSNSSRDIVELNLNDKTIKVFEEGAFKSLICLASLDLSRNEIIHITSKHFLDLTYLAYLNMSFNNILHLDNFVFKFLPNLEVLDLTHNQIIRVEDFAFHMAFRLRWLSVRYNQMSFFGGRHTLEHQTRLEYLDMSYNSFLVIKPDKYRFLDQLEGWDLSGNSAILFMAESMTIPLYNLRILNLSENQFMKSITAKDLKRAFPNDHLTVDINDNAFPCDYLEKLLEDLRYYMIHVAPGRTFNDTFQRQNILCDVLLAHPPKESLNEYYGNLHIKYMKRKTSPRPPTKDYEMIYETYRKDSSRHKHMLTALSIVVSISLLYDILIVVDYLLNYGYMKSMCTKRRVESSEEPIELVEGPLGHVPL